MPKNQPPDEKLPEAEADRRRDQVLKRMGKTAPKPRKGAPKKKSRPNTTKGSG